MSVIEDPRKVMQDFLAPELRAIAARLDALEKRFDGFKKRVDKQFDDIEHRAEKRQDDVMAAVGRLADYNGLRDRLARLESKKLAQQ